MNPFTYNISRLFDFSGRQNRQPYWLWVLISYGFQVILSMILMIPMMMSYFSALEPIMGKDQDYLRDHPEVAQAVMMKAMGPMMSSMMFVTLIIAVLFVVALAAATVRRLHDTNRSGWWSAPVFALQIAMPIVYMGTFSRMFDLMANIKPDMTPDQVNAMMAPLMGSFAAIWSIGMLNFVLMIVLIVFLCLRGTVGPNRFGPDPLGVTDFPEFR